MPTAEERIVHLEGQVNDVAQGLSDVRGAIRDVELRINSLEQRMDRLEQRMDRLEQRVDHLGQRLEARFDAVDTKMSRQFMWLVGIQVTMVLAVVTTLGAIVVTLLSRA